MITVERILAQVDELGAALSDALDERDRARGVAVHLKQELTEKEAELTEARVVVARLRVERDLARAAGVGDIA